MVIINVPMSVGRIKNLCVGGGARTVHCQTRHREAGYRSVFEFVAKISYARFPSVSV